ncbi:hypothetical protein BJY01DRAFT_260999 [Aspergillus pseudoustus]|uniref:D-alanine--D-alanine ligase C-terminal domain-containing protein n=1 Tax=Aspergillus pseudoustus TaxID=1810923 RepID=A0ABR4ITG6_9EURO
MKICLINSSYEGVNSPFEQPSSDPNNKYDDFPDPNRYISKDCHEFVTRYVTRCNAEAEIDEMRKEDLDMFMNYMWGIETDEVAGVEATRYLETKGVPILTNPSTFAAQKTGLRVPENTPGKFPKIVKYSDGYGSLNLDENSIRDTDKEVTDCVALLRKEKTPFGIIAQDYIIVHECSAIGVEMGKEVVGLTPLQYVFPKDTPDNEAFLTWYNNFEAVDKGVIKYRFVEEQPHMEHLQHAATEAFKALGVSGGAGWARIDVRLEESTGLVYVIEVNCIPVVFYPKGNTLGDDLVVGEKFPGGQAAFIDMLLATKQMQLGWHRRQNEHVAEIYDRFAPSYHSVWTATELSKLKSYLATNWDYSGTVLDVAWGTGGLGQLVHDQGIRADLSGIDLSPGMLENIEFKKYYKELRGAGEFDHIACFGALHFPGPVYLNAVLARMFMIARKSVSISVDDVSDEYVTAIKEKHGELTFNANHEAVYHERSLIYTSPTNAEEVYGFVMRFERVPGACRDGH